MGEWEQVLCINHDVLLSLSRNSCAQSRLARIPTSSQHPICMCCKKTTPCPRPTPSPITAPGLLQGTGYAHLHSTVAIENR